MMAALPAPPVYPHLLHECRRFTAARRTCGLVTGSGRRRSLGRLFNGFGPSLLDFLKATRMAFKPKVGVNPDAPFDPG